MLITREDIQRIGDEETLLHLLEEKLNLNIPEGATLAQIALPLPLPFLGLDDSIAKQIIDCQDFSGLPKDSLGKQRPFLIRFKRELGYSEILREVAEGLFRRDINPAEIFFICADEDFQPFAFAYFDETGVEDWHTELLTIFAWTQDNTNIHTSSEHELLASFFGEESTDEFENHLEDKTEINQFNVIESSSDYDLMAKVKNIGIPLIKLENICNGITTGYDRAFVIDEPTREQFLTKNPDNIKIIKRSPIINRKWRCDARYLICIPSSKTTQWPWSDARSESEAKRIFEEAYPAIYAHLDRYTDRLKKRSKSNRGKYYWEFIASNLYSMSERPKIIYPLYPTSMQAVYDSLEGIPTSSFYVIPTTDLSLLAILNSNCFQWYAKIDYSKPISNQLALTKGNMQNAPIAPRTTEQKTELSDWVEQVLADPTSNDVLAIEQEIDQLVYKLYELTPAEIALIEEETDP